MPAILAAVALLSLSAAAFGAPPAEQASRMTVAAPLPSGAAAPVEEQANVTVDVRRLDAIEALVREAIAEKKLPGAVVLVGRGDRILYQKAIGNRALVPAAEAMTVDTIFDLASLTKVVVTTTSVMMLVEQGRVRLSDRVAAYVPGFERYGKGDITVRHLLTHVSGLRPDVDLAELWAGYETAIALAVEEVPTSRPGERFVYSDINFFLLGDIVQRVSGQPLDRFAREHVFEPLGMKDTMFNPPASAVSRIAPTESCTRFGWPCQGPDMAMLRGDRPRSHRATDGRRGRPCGALQHGRRPGDVLPHAPRRGSVPGHARPLAARGREDDERLPRPISRRIRAVSAGTSIRRSRPTAASCCRWDRSGTPALPERQSGSIPSPGCSSSFSRIACTPTARVT